MKPITRREALAAGAATAAFTGLGELPLLGKPAPVSAAEATLDPSVVRLDSSIEPTVRLIEQTPRERLLEEVGARVRQGLSYRDLLAALLLAGVRNVEPRPTVGFQFHAVLVVNSAHLASISSPAEHRWLPLFWSLDYFKSAAERDRRQGGWTMGPVDEATVPAAHKALAAFHEAMDTWDETAADAAVAALARTAGADEIFEPLFRYGARDFRSIGHKAIFVAQSRRTLHCIGWRHAEPVLRSLAYALLMHEGDNPAGRDAEADRPYRRNLELVERIGPDWRGGTPDSGATDSLLETLRSGSDEEACDHVVELLGKGVSPQSIWDGLFVGAGELLLRQPAIVPLHAVTTTNALRFAFQTAADDRTRQLLMLQNAAFLPMFRDAAGGRGRLEAIDIGDLRRQAADADADQPLESIFAELDRNPTAAAWQTLAWLQRGGDAPRLIDMARALIFRKGTGAHDYKFSSAVLEDYYHVSPAWRNLYLASNMPKLRGSETADNPLVARIRAALK